MLIRKKKKLTRMKIIKDKEKDNKIMKTKGIVVLLFIFKFFGQLFKSIINCFNSIFYR